MNFTAAKKRDPVYSIYPGSSPYTLVAPENPPPNVDVWRAAFGPRPCRHYLRRDRDASGQSGADPRKPGLGLPLHEGSRSAEDGSAAVLLRAEEAQKG